TKIIDERGNSLIFSQNKVEDIFPNSRTSLIIVNLKNNLLKREKVKINIYYEGYFYTPSEYNPKNKRYKRVLSSITEKVVWLRPTQLWYPYIKDNFMKIRIDVTVPKNWIILTNGKLVEKKILIGKINFIYEEEKTGSLDIFLFAGPYVSKTLRTNEFKIISYLLPQHKNLLDIYNQKTAEIIVFYTKKFGSPNIKNIKMIEIGTEYGTGTSSPFGYAIASHLITKNCPIIAHEIAHLWWGETVLDNLGPDSWLREGFATFSENYYKVKTFSNFKIKRRILFDFLFRAISHGNPETPSILEAGEKELAQRYLVYEKPAYMLYTLKYLLGEKTFLEIMKTYLNQFRGKIATTSDFINIVNSVSSQNMDWFFNYYLKGKKVPRYRLKFEVNGKNLNGVIYQDFVPNDFSMPVDILINTNKRKILHRVLVRGSKEQFSLKLKKNEKIKKIIIDPNLSILAVHDELEAVWKARKLRISMNKIKNFKKIKKELLSLYKKYPENTYILHEIAQFYFMQKKWNEGLKIYQKIIDLAPNSNVILAFVNIAQIYELKGDRRKALYYFQKALEQGSRNYALMRWILKKISE
ncbi:tetratricopeptide repeat protein, partial [Candidatus Aminicenantes bacterium AH-873-B07]|nr:tetratricopeptide repeat protein [Candidatus Aminicenantes bacterium AH-873-B07]